MPTNPADLPNIPARAAGAGKAWTAAAESLADWALERLVVRSDRYGGYYKDNASGVAKTLTKPPKGPQPGAVTRDLLIRHFRAKGHEDVVGGHLLTPAADGRPSVGKAVGIDLDNHGGVPEAAARNLRYAHHLFHKTAGYGFRPLLLTWETGGYHLWVVFN